VPGRRDRQCAGRGLARLGGCRDARLAYTAARPSSQLGSVRLETLERDTPVAEIADFMCRSEKADLACNRSAGRPQPAGQVFLIFLHD
jgi:hypothetical protein